MWQPMMFSPTLAQAGGEGAPGSTSPGNAAPGIAAPAAGDEGVAIQSGAAGTGEQQTSAGGQGFFFIMMAVLVGMIVISMFSGRKDKKKKAEMMSAMGKGDRVQTIGGILGTVVEVRENDVLLKVDENANTKIRFAKSAVQTVLEAKDNKDDADNSTDETKDDV